MHRGMTMQAPSRHAHETGVVSSGLSLLKAGKPADVLRLIARSCPGGPKDSRLLVQQAYAHAALGHVAEALVPADLAATAPPQELWALDLLGNVFTLCHRPADAYAAFSRARDLAPARSDVVFNLATTAGFLGLRREAEDAYDQVIATAPDNAEAWYNRSVLRRQTARDNHVDALRARLEKTLPWQREVYLRYALGKELDDLGGHDEAFASFARGAALRRSHMRYSVAGDVEAMERISKVHDAAWCAPAQGAPRRGGPIFVLGMPRSGSTLLEQMLGRHPGVQPLGELPYFGKSLIDTYRGHHGAAPPSKEALIDASAKIDPAAIGRAYLSAIAPLRDDRPVHTDKLPINFLYAGLIARALPDAMLLHIRRSPIEVAWANFRTLFRDGYPYSYDFAEIAAYHRAYEVLMEHWRTVLGERLIEVDYEDLVASPQTVMEGLLARLGLKFDPACLSPEKADGAVMTASSAQVRDPIHTASVAATARYGSHLGPLRSALGL